MFLLRYYHRAASNRKICFVRHVMNGAEESERESERAGRRRSHRGIGRLLPAPGMENLPMAVPWLRGRDHNLYNGLAKVYPESRFCEKTGWRMEGNRPFPFVAARYGRCIIIAPRPSPVQLLAPPSRLHFIHNVPAYEPAQSRIRR